MCNYRITALITIVVLLYFAWMDVALFHLVYTSDIDSFRTTNASPSATNSPYPHLFNPFNGLSVKMMMMDQFNNYIHAPAAYIFNEVTHFSSTFYFVSPNMISFIGFLFAVAAAKCVSMEVRAFHYLGIVLFEIRNWIDAVDGIVARSRMGMYQHVTLRNTSGYIVDATADTFGFAALMIGSFLYLSKTSAKHKTYLPVNTSDTFYIESKNGVGSSSASYSATTTNSSKRKIFLTMLAFGAQLAISAFFWDHYVYAYHNLLESQPSSPSQAKAQTEVLKSSVTWVIMWFWRISNAHILMEFFLYAILIDKLWKFLTWIRYIGIAHLLTLAFLTQIHVTVVRNYIFKAV